MHILERGRTKSNLRKLETEAGLNLPRAALAQFGCLASVCCFFAVLVGVFFLHPGMLSALLCVLFGFLAAGAIIKYIDPGKAVSGLCDSCRFRKEGSRPKLWPPYKNGARHGEDGI